MNDQSHLLMSLSYTLNDPRVPEEMRKAADTITRLTAENERLRAALELFECDCEGEELCFNTDNCRNFIARAALSGDKQ